MGNGILRLREVLELRGITPSRLTRDAKISYSSLSLTLHGKRLPRVSFLVDIANHHNMDLRELFKPTKQVGDLNGFLDYKGQPHTIKNVEDLERFIKLIKNL